MGDITASAVVAVNGEDEGHSTTTIVRASRFLESSERCWQVPFCVTGRSRALGSEEGGKAMFPMADLWDDQELGKAR